jgi:hypothetical protein
MGCADRPVVPAVPSLSRALAPSGNQGGPCGSRPLDRSSEGPRALATCLHRADLVRCSRLREKSLGPYGPYVPLGRLGAIKPTTAATARFIRDQRFGGFFICWSCCCCPAVFVCGSDFAGFCIGSRGTGDRFPFVFFWIAENDLTFGFFGFFTGSASAFATLIVVPRIPPSLRAGWRLEPKQRA